MDWASVVMDNVVVQDTTTITRRPDDEYLRGPCRNPPQRASTGCPRGAAIDAEGDGCRDRPVGRRVAAGSVPDDALLRASGRGVAVGAPVRGGRRRARGRGCRARRGWHQVREGQRDAADRARGWAATCSPGPAYVARPWTAWRLHLAVGDAGREVLRVDGLRA